MMNVGILAKECPYFYIRAFLTGMRNIYEISKLEAQGYLKISDEKYYLPEIIRLPLGFTYERGARPLRIANRFSLCYNFLEKRSLKGFLCTHMIYM